MKSKEGNDAGRWNQEDENRIMEMKLKEWWRNLKQGDEIERTVFITLNFKYVGRTVRDKLKSKRQKMKAWRLTH